MANIWDTIDKFENLLSRTRSTTSRVGSEVGGFSFRPNAPRMVTVILSIALILAGLTASGTLSIGFVNDLLKQANLDFTRDQGYLLLLGSPVVLILGSLFPGI
jgi:hypothetical protein